ncbi:MAG: TetR/AcrR family transcriptional regulator [Aestuariibaculum sp.]
MGVTSATKPKQKKIKTRQKIVNQAVQLFNANGVQNVTIRHIAAKMGIAHGNLTYHFKTKEDLLLAIYEQMRTQMSQSYLTDKGDISSFEHFHKLLLYLEYFHLKYSFFNVDVLEISRMYPKINKVLQKTLELRQDQMVQLFNAFISDNLVVEEPTDRYLYLRHTVRIIITFWQSQIEVLRGFSSNEGKMVETIWHLVKPYMTNKGKQEYVRVTNLFLRYEDDI